MIRSRRLRRSLPDAKWLERYASGESLRSLARELEVAHTTLARRLRRPGMALELREARHRVRAKQKAGRDERAEERRAERKLRARARAEAKLDRAHEVWRRSAKPRRRSEFEVRLDENEGPRGLLSSERWSINDELAEEAVSAGGGIEEVIQVTPLRTRLSVYESIDAQIVVRALRNERRRQRADQLPTSGLRRLRPDAALVLRWAAGESLRRLADDYGVSHTTLLRYFRRPEIAKALRSGRRELEKQRRREAHRAIDDDASRLSAELAGRITSVRCPRHRIRIHPKIQDSPDGETQLVALCCCWEAEQELLRRLRIDEDLLPPGMAIISAGQS